MSPHDRDPLSDDQLDALLARRFRDTTPEFEARWSDLRRGLRTAQSPRRATPSWAAWLGMVSAATAMAAILFALHPWRPAPAPAAALPPDVDTLLTMDAVLETAVPLLNTDDRDALLNLPVSQTPHT